ncbi:MAG TPA: hypothetical protein VKR06_44785, partial [Ktedonosporobacter sp.]|nr:hypothetical protein [Ktedonosporobacter sp.]
MLIGNLIGSVCNEKGCYGADKVLRFPDVSGILTVPIRCPDKKNHLRKGRKAACSTIFWSDT